MSMYLSIGTTITSMEDSYGTACDDLRLERIARREPLSARCAAALRRTAGALLATASTLDHRGPAASGTGSRRLPDMSRSSSPCTPRVSSAINY